MAISASSDSWLLLHGTPLTPAVWAEVAPRLRDGGDVVCPDLSGHREPAPGVGSVQAALARRALASPTLGSGGLHVVGHSFGGQVALEVALLVPDRLRSLTILCSRDTPYPAFAAAAASLRRGDPVDVEAALRRWFRPEELASGAAIVQSARRCLRDADRDAWACDLEAIAAYDRSGAVSGISAPATLLAAELDPVSTPAAMAGLAARLPRARLRLLPGAAHMSVFIDPAGLAEVIRGAARPEP
ncbi:MAG: alpha/beta fold hydrolase [Candidatus Dormibacteria bacterium]